NSIIAQNVASANLDLSATLISLGHNLIGSTAGVAGLVSSDLTGLNPALGSLQSNGGPTQTLALLSGSPAIDAGDPTAAPGTDQRGLPRVVNAIIDIGAF